MLYGSGCCDLNQVKEKKIQLTVTMKILCLMSHVTILKKVILDMILILNDI